jgi:Lrp/AsnC family leucine-responsive transcriptional regulator
MLQELDSSDLRLLAALQENARLSHVELAERVHLSPSQCQRRLKKLEQQGVIRGYATLLERDKLGLRVMAFVNVTLEKHGENPARDFRHTIAHEEAFLECWSVSGDADYLLRVVATDLKGFSDFLMYRLLRMPMVANVRSSILLEPIKHTTALPLRLR